MRIIVGTFLFLALTVAGFSQDTKWQQTITGGAEFRPIFPAAFLNTGEQSVTNDSYSVTVSPKFGFSAGLSIRYSFHKRFALETGINFVQRNYDLEIQRDSIAPFTGQDGNLYPGNSAFESKTDFRIIGYELPIKALFSVQVAEKLFLNSAAGLQLTFFPSDIFTASEAGNTNDQAFRHYSSRLGFDGKPGVDGFIHGGGILNLGMEYRTKNSGSFYIGATYHVPFANVYRSRFEYTDPNAPPESNDRVQQIFLNGSYLTFDIRYFFRPKEILKKKKKRKSKSKKPKSED